MRKVMGVLAVCVGVGLMVGYAFTQGKAPETIVLKEIQKAQPAVTFSHATHSKSFNCTECHHTYKGEGAIEKCSKCHGEKEEGKKVSLKNAFHNKCNGCHKAKKAEGKNPPTACSGCHKK